MTDFIWKLALLCVVLAAAISAAQAVYHRPCPAGFHRVDTACVRHGVRGHYRRERDRYGHWSWVFELLKGQR